MIELAARVADGDEIRAEHIFSGFDGERPIGFEISSFWLVRWLIRGGGLRVARTAVAASFVGMAVICLTAGRSAAAESANTTVWMLWEPVVFGLFLLVGTVWCRHLCPLGRLGTALSPVAPLTVAARQSICASTCTTHDCYKGNEEVPGCTVYTFGMLWLVA